MDALTQLCVLIPKSAARTTARADAHERAYHAYDGYTSPFETTKASANPCRDCDTMPALFISVAESRSEVILRCPHGEQTY